MAINKLSLYGCCLLFFTGNVLADCNTPVSRYNVPDFIAQDQIDDYLAEENQRQQTLCSQDKGLFGQDKAIYVQDNRIDIYRASGYIREAARSTAALIPAKLLKKQGNEYIINHNTTLQNTGWCANEPFASQPVTSTCTAFLVDKNILVTAGHCLRGRGGRNIPLDSYYVVFGFQMHCLFSV